MGEWDVTDCANTFCERTLAISYSVRSGRITVFSLTDCPHCLRTKEALKSRNLPYTEINLSDYPQKRSDMLQLADRLTVPQVFFNSKHIGGSDDTIKVLEAWDDEGNVSEAFQNHVGADCDPTDPRLQVPTEPPLSVPEAPPRDQKSIVELPDGTSVSVLEITEKLKEMLDIQDRRFGWTKYKNCFVGGEAVKAMAQHYGISASEAVTFGKDLQKQQILHHVVNEHEFDDNSNFYRLQCHHTPNILNTYRVWTERVDPLAMNLLRRLKKQLGKVLSTVTKDGKIDYKAACTVPDFFLFEEAVCELQGVNMENMDEATRLAFGINCYNLLIPYAFAKVGIGSSNFARASFFGSVSFNIGGHVLSFNDLENGLLRGNRKPPYSLTLPFGKSDPRRVLPLKEPDCRIHFALNCGATSCPPVKNFTVESIGEELRIVAMSFMEENCSIDGKAKTVTLSSILNWYRVDFAKSIDALPRAVLPFLRGEKKKQLEQLLDSKKRVSVKFANYDWGVSIARCLCLKHI